MTADRIASRTATATALDRAAAVACALALAATLFAAGFGACTLPATTRLLAQATENDAVSPYTDEQLTDLAVETRGFTVDDFGRSSGGEAAARDRIAADIVAAAREASAEGSPVRDRWSAALRAVDLEADEAPQVTLEKLAAVGDAYALDADALSHLQDCNDLIRAAVPVLWAVAALAAASLAFLLARGRRRLAGGALVVAPVALIAALAALGAWAAVDFNGLFAAFHAVLFPQGNWTFSYESLLICLYPLDFWMGMGAVWLATTAALSILAIAIGARLRRKTSRNEA